MDISALDLFTSIASGLLTVVGFTLGIIAFRKWQQSKNNLLLITSVLFISIPITWLIDTIIVTVALFGGEMSPKAIIYFAAFGIPIFTAIWFYLTGSLYVNRPWVKQLMLAVGIISALVFYTSVYILGQGNVTPISDDSVLRNIDYEGPGMIMIYFYGALGLLFVVPTYLYFSMKTTNPLMAFRFRMIGLGVLSFDLSAVADAVLRFEELWFFLLTRLLILVSLILLSVGYNTPERYRKKYGAS